MKSVICLFLTSFLTANSECVAVVSSEPEISVNQTTVQLEGWFSARGEWILFPSKDFENYDPFNKEESKKCVSLINETGFARSKYQVLDGNKAIVTGFAVKYDDLQTGNSDSDRLLSKKYFNDELVENYCLRDFVFVVKNIRKRSAFVSFRHPRRHFIGEIPGGSGTVPGRKFVSFWTS